MKLKRRLQNDQGLLLTPLIDMIFLVVIFFMLNASFSINPAIRINLPEAYSSEAVMEREVVVTVKTDENIFIGGVEVPRDSFVQELRKEIARLGNSNILVQGDASILYSTMIDIMDMARIAGVDGISFVTDKKRFLQ